MKNPVLLTAALVFCALHFAPVKAHAQPQESTIDILDDIVGEKKIKGVPRYDEQFMGRYVNELDKLATIPTDSETIQRYKKKGRDSHHTPN